MADFDNPAFDEDIDDVTEDDPQTDFVDADMTDADTMDETELPSAQPRDRSLQQELLQAAVDSYYNKIAEKGQRPSLGRDISKFKLDRDGKLRLKAYPNMDIINARTGNPIALSTVATRRGGSNAIRNDLGFVDWSSKKPRLPAEAVANLQTLDNDLSKAADDVDKIELQDLGAVATTTLQNVETSLSESMIGNILETIDGSPLNFSDSPLKLKLRELRGLDKAMQTIRGELTNNLAKLSELDSRIALEKRKLDQAEDEFTKRRVAERLRSLEDERAARLEAASTNREALRSQIHRIRETIYRVLNEDTTLGERIKTLFREQGITIASIITAIGMAISTLVLALTGGGGGGGPVPTPPPPHPNNKEGVKEWVKKHLQALGRVLATLAGKAAAALPGVIGSIVSWLLGLLAKTAGWLAENLWAVILAAGGMLIIVIRDWLSQKPKRG